VAALFLAGYIPGILWALCCMAVAVCIAVKKGYQGTPGRYDWKNLGISTLRAIPSLSLILVVIGGIVKGVFTATEGSAIAVVYALFLGICYRNITWKSFWKTVVDSARMSGMIVFLIGVSNIMGWVMAFTQIPQAIASALLGALPFLLGGIVAPLTGLGDMIRSMTALVLLCSAVCLGLYLYSRRWSYAAPEE